MASSPEYDKEPKAPDKSATTVSAEDSKLLHNSIHDQQTNSDPKSTHNSENAEAENNKDVEALDDKSLQALLEEAIAYKGPKDREGKSSLFKELLEEAEQDDQASEAAAARSLGGCRGCSLQDLVAALASEPVGPRRQHSRRHQPAPSNVSTRATQGGSLPSGVDTSSLVCEEPARGAGYLATVRCVNPPPLADRRVSASAVDAPAALASAAAPTAPATIHDLDVLARRSKPTYPMTYTARATLEIGSGSVCSGRAVTTTTASNQVRTHQTQLRLMNALHVRHAPPGGGDHAPRGPQHPHKPRTTRALRDTDDSQMWTNNVNRWYEGLAAYALNSDRYQSLNQRVENKYYTRAQYGFGNDYQETGTHLTTGVNTNLCVGSNVAISNAGISPILTCTDLAREPMADVHITSSNRPEKSGKINTYAHKVVTNYLNTNIDNDSSSKKTSPGRLGENLVKPNLASINPKNIRSMSIGQSVPVCDSGNSGGIGNVKKYSRNKNMKESVQSSKAETKVSPNIGDDVNPLVKYLQHEPSELEPQYDCSNRVKRQSEVVNIAMRHLHEKSVVTIPESDIELKDISSNTAITGGNTNKFSDYLSDQQKLFKALESSEDYFHDFGEQKEEKEEKNQKDPREFVGLKEETKTKDIELIDIRKDVIYKFNDKNNEHCDKNNEKGMELINIHNTNIQEVNAEEIEIKQHIEMIEAQNNSEIYYDCHPSDNEYYNISNEESRSAESINVDKQIETLGCKNSADNKQSNVADEGDNDRYVLAELSNNAYIFLTLPKRLLTSNNSDDKDVRIQEIENNNNIKPYVPGNNAVVKPTRKKKDKALIPKNIDTRKETFNKNALKVLMFENQLKSDRIDRILSIKSRLSPITDEVDSAIPFSCITTPEVVASCNTTSSTSQSAVAVDAKPLQLVSSYRAVASVTGCVAHLAPQTRHAHATHDHADTQPRSVIPSSFNGLPLSRPNYGSTATTAPDEFKKSLDENGNAVQGFSSPLAGSAQHKKPRRKKSSKNETVIDCRQIDGYQGDKDVNELLRFIESNAERARAPKLPRAKHRDDNDDKPAKKRSAERRKDKDKVKRATSLEEVSRTKLEDLTHRADPAHPHAHAPAGKPERRSWGDAREPDHDDPAAELTDFQTVTKKRKQRRRADEPAPRRTRAPSPPGPRHQPVSAPPSERSNDSNDDLDSAQSPPPAAPPALPHASYADIARTRHNIPDLIESCNFYAEGEGEPQRADGTAAPAPETDGYPALEMVRAAPVLRRARDAKPPPPARRDRKERAPGSEPREAHAADCPAPDVVADRRPPVILLDATARPRDMDGVTFGFDINEQLLSGPARRPRCDLLRDALDESGGAGAPAAGGGGGGGGAGGVAVAAGCGALRYVAPDPPPDTNHLHQIIDYVGNAWEEAVRCGGKARYFSE